MYSHKPKKEKRKWSRWLIAIPAILSACLLIVAVLSSYIAPDNWWIALVFHLSFPLWWLINFVFVLWGIVRWRRFVWWSLAALLLSWGLFAKHFQAFNAAPQAEEEKDISILSYNLRSFMKEGHERQGAMRDSAVKYLEARHAKIVCLQEFITYANRDMLKQMKKSLQVPNVVAYDYRYHSAGRSYTDMMAIFTAYPVVDKKPFYHDNKLFAIRADIKIDTTTYSVYNVHLASNHFVPDDFGLFADAASALEEDKRAKVKDLLYKLKNSGGIRAQQVRVLGHDMESVPYPVIICGDFNDTPASHAYRRLRRGKTDAFVECGSGYGNTYNGPLPPMRIDYLLFDKDKMEVLDYRVEQTDISDHYPVWARIQIQP